ncbi:MAG: RidA family protein [Pseudomonadota bacterium]
MSGDIEASLHKAGIKLPEPSKAAGTYVPARACGQFLFVSGQLPLIDGKLMVSGRVGEQVTPKQAREAARLCGCHILAQAQAALGSLDRITQIVKLGGFVACRDDFTGHPGVINGASDLMVQVFGEAQGAHARFAVGVASLPLGAPVELEAVIAFDPQ